MAQTPNDQFLAAGTVLPGESFAGSFGSFQGQIRPSFASQVEENATAQAAGLVNAIPAALTATAMVSGMIPGLGGGLDPFSGAFSGFSSGKAIGMGGMRGAALGALGPGLLMGGVGAYSRFGVEHAVEGQRNFLATRHMMRSLPGSGFGSQSVMSSPMGMGTSSMDVTSLQAGMASVANQYGMSQGQTRNVFDNLASAGQIDTSSVHAARSSFRTAMTELKGLATQMGADIDEAVQVYQFLQSSGLQSSVQRAQAVRGLTSTSSMLGLSVPQTMEYANAGIGAARSMGLSGGAGMNLALSSLNVAGTMQAASALPQDYLARVGGYAGYGQRLMELRLGSIQSDVAMGHMGQMFSPEGDISLGNALSGRRPGSGYSFASRADPYMLAKMQEGFLENQAGIVLGRVRSIRDEAGSTLEANRQQYRYLSSMGIADPQEQLAFLGGLRNEGRAALLASGQGARDSSIAARDSTERELQSAAETFRGALRTAVQGVAQEFENAGTALQVRTEQWNGRMSYGLYGRSRSYSPGSYDAASMEEASWRIMGGDWTGTSATPVRDFQRTLERDPALQGYIGSSANATGALPGFQHDRMGRLSRGLQFATVTGPRRLSSAVDRGMQRALAFTLGYPSSPNDPYQPYSGAYGGSYHSLSQDQAAPGTISMGDGRYATSSQYIQMVARDHGAEYDPSTGRLVRFSEGQYGAFRQQYGGSMQSMLETAQQGLIGYRGQAAEDSSAAFGRTTGALSGAAFGARIGARLGSPGGGWGIAGGVLLGGAVGATVGYFSGESAGRSAMGALRGFTSDTSMEQSFTLSPQQAESLRAGRAGTQLRDTLSMGMFGDRYSELSGSRRSMFNEMLRREGGEIGAAMTGGENAIPLSDDQFTAILAADATSSVVTMALGVGDTYENRIQALSLASGETSTEDLDLSPGRLRDLRNTNLRAGGDFGLARWAHENMPVLDRIYDSQGRRALADREVQEARERGGLRRAVYRGFSGDGTEEMPMELSYLPTGIPLGNAGRFRQFLDDEMGEFSALGRESLWDSYQQAMAEENRAGNTVNAVPIDPAEHGNFVQFGGLPEFRGLTDDDVGRSPAQYLGYGRFSLLSASGKTLEDSLRGLNGTDSTVDLGRLNAERHMTVGLMAAREVAAESPGAGDDVMITSREVFERVRQQGRANGLPAAEAARIARQASEAYGSRPLSRGSLRNLTEQGSGAINSANAVAFSGALELGSELAADSQMASLLAARSDQSRAAILAARGRAEARGEDQQFINSLIESPLGQTSELVQRVLADGAAGGGGTIFELLAEDGEAEAVLDAEEARLVRDVENGGGDEAQAALTTFRRMKAMSLSPDARRAATVGSGLFFSGEGGSFNADALSTISDLGYSSGVLGQLATIFDPRSPMSLAASTLGEMYSGAEGEEALYKRIKGSGMFQEGMSPESFQANRDHYMETYLENIRSLTGTGATAAIGLVEGALIGGGMAPTATTTQATEDERRARAEDAMIALAEAATDGGTGLLVREASSVPVPDMVRNFVDRHSGN